MLYVFQIISFEHDLGHRSRDTRRDKMKSVIATVILLMACHARCDKVCQAPQSEAVYYWTGSNWDFYVINDYDQGLVLKVSGDDPNGDRWVLANVKTGVVYLNTPEGGCHYQQFLPEHIEVTWASLYRNFTIFSIIF